MRRLYPALLAALVLTACMPRGYPVDRWVIPRPGTVPDSIVRDAWRTSQLVVTATALAEERDPVLSQPLALGSRRNWWLIQLRVTTRWKGSLGQARYLDYGPVPPGLTPGIPWRLAHDDIVIHRADHWITAPVELGRPAIYFLRRCYYCAEIPSRVTRGRAWATPWLAALTLPLEDTLRLRGLP